MWFFERAALKVRKKTAIVVWDRETLGATHVLIVLNWSFQHA